MEHHNKMDGNNQFQNIGSTVTFVIKFLDIFCFILAVVFTSLFLIETIPITTCTDKIILVIALILSIIVLKQDVILWAISLLKAKNTNAKPRLKLGPVFRIYNKLNIGTLIFPVIRTIVFNVIAQSFPIILLAIVFFIVASFGGWVDISSESWTTIGMVGVLLTLFRFYVNSKQNAAEQTISEIINTTQSTTLSQVSHLKFREWVETNNGDNYNIVQTIKNIFDTRSDLKKTLDEYSRPSSNRRKGLGISSLNVKNLNIYPKSFPDMDSFYYELEHSNVVAGKPQNSELQEYYKKFFLEYCFCEIKKNLIDKFEFREIGRIIVTNINIIDENGASFSNITNFKKFWEYFGDDGFDDTVKDNTNSKNKLNTASDYVDELMDMVLKFMFNEIFIEYKRDSNN